MLESHSFVTRARTIDHLGREQIADCPTAISELWKNSYDAYARHVTLDIFDGKVPVAALCDDGHGMNEKEFLEKWLVVGTESKAGSPLFVPPEDKNGLPFRPRQGQKGIGRLSTGYLGPLLLLVSKRKSAPFVASLIDWRVFQNPYLLLHDVRIPVSTFETRDQLPAVLDELREALIGNIWGSGKDDRSKRIEEAWEKFHQSQSDSGDLFQITTRTLIEESLVETPFEERHFSRWPVWRGDSKCGTAMFVGDANFDLRAQVEWGGGGKIAPNSVQQAQARFSDILSNFSDPFPKSGEAAIYSDANFECSVHAWNGEERRQVIGKNDDFGQSFLDSLEHIVDGFVDEEGTFHGRVKAFGKWVEDGVAIKLTEEIDLPTRADSKIGRFFIYIAAAEQEKKNTSMPDELHSRYVKNAEIYSGFMVYRDGLRVMPYGKPGSDFFEIENRRSLHAGREFWNLRRMFGRVAISRLENPNLRDKAGREGLIDNRSAKGFRAIVVNILMQLARSYFGTGSKPRVENVPANQVRYARKKEEEARAKHEAQIRRKFRHELRNALPVVERLNQELEELRFEATDAVGRVSAADLMSLRRKVSDVRDNFVRSRLADPPQELGTIEAEYDQYLGISRQAASALKEVSEIVHSQLERVVVDNPTETLKIELNRAIGVVRSRISQWQSEAQGLLQREQERIKEIAIRKTNQLHNENIALVHEVDTGRITIANALRTIDLEKDRLMQENEELFLPYISALESLQASIDLASLATFGSHRIHELQEELDRLNGLAQLGIAIEIIGHELEGFDSTIQAGLNELPENVRETRAYKQIKGGHDGLTERLRFLAPLKLSGRIDKEWISGAEIYDYISEFFDRRLKEDQIELRATPGFVGMQIFETRARLYPVFVNLVNNSRYWVTQRSDTEREIILGATGEKVIVADSGPGVEEKDIPSLFKLFFTRRALGGRGVGLYLCRANLAAGGHHIYYVVEEAEKVLPGANFAIKFSSVQESLL